MTIPAIEKGIPLPPPALHGRPRLYEFADMEVGDSRPAFIGNDYPADVQHRVASAAQGWAKRHAPERKFTTRMLRDKDGNEIVRYWRVK